MFGSKGVPRTNLFKTEGVAACGQQGARRENTRGIRPTSNAAGGAQQQSNRTGYFATLPKKIVGVGRRVSAHDAGEKHNIGPLSAVVSDASGFSRGVFLYGQA